jgi:hypothetical protein
MNIRHIVIVALLAAHTSFAETNYLVGARINVANAEARARALTISMQLPAGVGTHDIIKNEDTTVTVNRATRVATIDHTLTVPAKGIETIDLAFSCLSLVDIPSTRVPIECDAPNAAADVSYHTHLGLRDLVRAARGPVASLTLTADDKILLDGAAVDLSSLPQALRAKGLSKRDCYVACYFQRTEQRKTGRDIRRELNKAGLPADLWLIRAQPEKPAEQ